MAPADRRCLLCGEPCSVAEEEDAMEIPSTESVVRDASHTPVELIAANCPHCEADIAIDPDKPLARQRCHGCGQLLAEPPKRKSRMRKRSQFTPDGVLIRRSRERVWMPIAGIMLALVIATIFAIWMMHRPEAEAAPAEETLPPDDRLAIKALVAAFTAARTPEEVLPLLREPDKFEKPLRAWCAAQPGALPRGGELQGIRASREVFGVTLRQAEMLWADQTGGLLLVVKTPAGWRVDWRAFAGLADLSVEEFSAQQPQTPVLLLAVVRRTDYYNGAYTDKSAWLSLHVSDRMGDHAFYAYAPRSDAALMKALEELPPGGRRGDLEPAKVSRRLALRLHFKTAASAALRQAEVTAVEGDGWYLP